MTSGRRSFFVKTLLTLLFLAFVGGICHLKRDKIYAFEWKYWFQLDIYKRQNAELSKSENRTVFFGDSITESWAKRTQFFDAHHIADRGVAGQTTDELVVRFRQDVIGLHPATVVILAGTNDIGETDGPVALSTTESNIRKMAESGKNHGIRVVLCSILPVIQYPLKPDIDPKYKIVSLNNWLRDYAKGRGFTYVDYWTPMQDGDGRLKKSLTVDGLHPNDAGYSVMERIVGPLLN